ncbi:patatin-like phospholipase family protein [Zavarzinia sp. CC-PAN008]|uniref:patatin-like phospholipase family protein n=1 Tax=Zavarzinia sp. CC-PAN008 TaxID=3243332 RepID=UPI003F74455B
MARADDRISLAGALGQVPLFAGLEPGALDLLAEQGEWFSLPGGRTLFEEGQDGTDMYVILSGMLSISVGDGRGGERQVARIRAPATVGEMALLTGHKRSASVRTLRDSALFRVERSVYQAIAQRFPAALTSFAGVLVDRLEAANRGRAAADDRPRTLAMVPMTPGAEAQMVSEGVAAALGASGGWVRVLDSSFADRSEGWFHDVEHGADHVLYVADPEPSAWTRFTLRQADRVILLAEAGQQPTFVPDLNLVQSNNADLVTVRRGAMVGRAPEMAGVDFRCSVRLGVEQDYARLARVLAGRSVGLVLSGGGARGFAHIGVVRALHEAGVPIDRVGGTSMGAIIAAGLAMGWNHEDLVRRIHAAFVARSPLNDWTLPLIALVRGRRVTRLLREHFGDMRIEDLALPFFCVAANLTSGRVAVHRTGALWRALRSTIAIPGLLPPLIEEGELLVDGAVMNNLPTDIMAAQRRGPTIGVDVARDSALHSLVHDLEEESIWKLAFRKRAPGIVAILMRSATVSSDAQAKLCRTQADVLFEPELSDVDLRDWKAFDRVVETGYRHAMARLETMDLKALGLGP